jgi:hypothetical protein
VRHHLKHAGMCGKVKEFKYECVTLIKLVQSGFYCRAFAKVVMKCRAL